MLSHEEARAFYDRFGSKQDQQAFYEDAAVDALRSHAELGTARCVVEFGCGTGRHAEQMLSRELGSDARYVGFDVSWTMIQLATKRLERWSERAEVRRTDGAPRLAFGRTLPTRAIARVWSAIHRLRPKIVGGCRPIDVAAHLGDAWDVVHHDVVVAFGLSSEVLVARSLRAG